MKTRRQFFLFFFWTQCI